MATAGGAAGGLLNVLFLSLGAGAAWLVARRGFGFGSRASLAVLLPWLSPDLWRLGMVSLSEPLFVLLLIASVGAAARALEGRGTRRIVLLGVLLGLLSLTRTVGLVVAGAVLLSFLLERRPREAGLLCAVVAVLVIPWTLWSSARAADLAPPLRELMGPYGRWLAAQYLADPVGALGRALSDTGTLAAIGGSLYLPGLRGGAAIAAGVVGTGVFLAALGARRASGRMVVLVLIAYGLVLWLWPHTERRLVAPVLPLLGLGVGAAVATVGRRTDAVGGPPRLVLALWAGTFAVLGTAGLIRGSHLEAYRMREVMLARAVAAVEGSVPPEGVVGVPEFWGAIHLHTGRPVSPSARFLPLADESEGTPLEQYRLWDAAGVEYVLLEHGGQVHRAALDQLDERCPGAVELLASWQGGLLVRLAWDDRCRMALGI